MRDSIRQRRPLDQLHDQRAQVASGVSRTLLDPVQVRNVWMVERGENFGFALEARQAITIRGERRGEHLDRHLTLQRRVGRAVDLAHAAFANLSGNLVRAYARAGTEGQAAILVG